MKKLLILQSSPRKNGNLYQMADELSQKYKSKGFEVETIDVCSLQFHDCIACMKCRSSNKCVFTDDATEVGKKIQQADVIAVAAPVWWGNMPGHLKSLFDRNVYVFMGESKSGIPTAKLKGKKISQLDALNGLYDVNITKSFSDGSNLYVFVDINWRRVGNHSRGYSKRVFYDYLSDSCIKDILWTYLYDTRRENVEKEEFMPEQGIVIIGNIELKRIKKGGHLTRICPEFLTSKSKFSTNFKSFIVNNVHEFGVNETLSKFSSIDGLKISKIIRKFCVQERINKLDVCYTKQKAEKFDCKTQT